MFARVDDVLPARHRWLFRASLPSNWTYIQGEVPSEIRAGNWCCERL